MFKIIKISVVFILFVQAVFGQIPEGLNYAESPKTMYKYPKVKWKKVKYAKYYLKTIDLTDSVNSVLLQDSLSFLHLLLNEGITDSTFNVFDASVDATKEFDNQITYDRVKDRMGAEDQLIEVEKDSEWVVEKIEGKMQFQQIKQLLVYELHLFDEKNSLVHKQVVGLSPVRHYHEYADIGEKYFKRKVAWFYYPQLRSVLAAIKINESKYSIDDFFARFQYIAKDTSFNYYLRFGNDKIKIPCISIPLETAYKIAENNKKVSLQTHLKNAEKESKPTFVDTSLIVSAKYVYSLIEAKDEQNNALFHPFWNAYKSLNLQSLSSVLFDLVEQGAITAYDTNPIGEYQAEIDSSKIRTRMGGDDIIVEVMDWDGEFVQRTIKGEYYVDEIRSYMVKELHLQAADTVYKYIEAICPIRHYYKEEDDDRQNPQYRKIFWAKFNELRPLLKDKYIFDVDNKNVGDIVYADFFDNRMFATTPYKEREEPNALVDSATEEEIPKEISLSKKYAIAMLPQLFSPQKWSNQPAELNIAYQEKATYSFSEIDLAKHENTNLYYPVLALDYLNYYSLSEIIYRKIKSKTIITYQITDSLKEQPIPNAEVLNSFGEELIILNVEDVETGELVEKELLTEARPDEVLKYRLLKKHIDGKTEIYAICPIRYEPNYDGESEAPFIKPIGWFKFKDLEEDLKKYFIYKQINPTMSDKTFYQFFKDGDYVDLKY